MNIALTSRLSPPMTAATVARQTNIQYQPQSVQEVIVMSRPTTDSVKINNSNNTVKSRCFRQS